MQTKPNELLYQQIVLTHLGYYKGKLDGIWSAKCRAAKCTFENEIAFVPGLPNRGLPFTLEYMHPLPVGFMRIPNPQGKGSLLTHSTITEAQMQEYLKRAEVKADVIYKRELDAHKEAKKTNAKVEETPVAPKVLPVVADGPIVASSEPTVTSTSTGNSNNNNNNNNNSNNNHNHNKQKHKQK